MYGVHRVHAWLRIVEFVRQSDEEIDFSRVSYTRSRVERRRLCVCVHRIADEKQQIKYTRNRQSGGGNDGDRGTDDDEEGEASAAVNIIKKKEKNHLQAKIF